MMKAVSLAALLMGLLAAGEGVKSGPAVGEEVPGPFKPWNVNGPNAGERSCLYCRFGTNPAVMVFARDVTDPLVKLIEALDAETGKNAAAQMGSCVIFLGSRDKLEPKLKELTQKLNLKHTVLAVEAVPGPEAYQIAREADVTVLLYTKVTVKANHAFKKGALDDKAVQVVLADVPKLFPGK